MKCKCRTQVRKKHFYKTESLVSREVFPLKGVKSKALKFDHKALNVEFILLNLSLSIRFNI